MQVIINHKICDNSPACGGISACTTNALYWDDADNKICFDESKCIGCGACERACPVMAIVLTKTKEEARKVQSEIDNDPRTAADLFTDRYGSDIVSVQPTDSDDVMSIVKSSTGLIVLELYDEELLRCLVTSIPVSEIFDGIKYTHIKSQPNDNLKQELNISELPALVLFRDGKMIGKVEGYFENNDAEKGLLLKKVNNILNPGY